MKQIQTQSPKTIEDVLPGAATGPDVPGTFSPSAPGILSSRAANDYVVYLSLRIPGFELFQARATNSSGQWGPPFPMPAFSQNCFSDCDGCLASGSLTAIYVVQCNDLPFKLELRFRKPGSGNGVVTGKVEADISPDCRYGGVQICVG